MEQFDLGLTCIVEDLVLFPARGKLDNTAVIATSRPSSPG